jgi:D-glycero-D-manno-heptose 1,7-bisphosphate phosphatase
MKAVFFDRDGVVNHRIMCGYVTEPEDLELHTDFIQFFPSVFQKGFVPILITNQQGVGKGLMTHWDLHQVHQKNAT